MELLSRLIGGNDRQLVPWGRRGRRGRDPVTGTLFCGRLTGPMLTGMGVDSALQIKLPRTAISAGGCDGQVILLAGRVQLAGSPLEGRRTTCFWVWMSRQTRRGRSRCSGGTMMGREVSRHRRLRVLCTSQPVCTVRETVLSVPYGMVHQGFRSAMWHLHHPA